MALVHGLADRALAQGQIVAAGVFGFLRQLRKDGDGVGEEQEQTDTLKEG